MAAEAKDLRSARVRATAALIVTIGLVVTIVAAFSPQAGAVDSVGSARAVGLLATPVTTTSGKLTLQVDPDTGINPVGGTITVSGSGFDPTSTLYVAVCAADGKAPADLSNCVGGAIPDANQTQAWGYVTPDGTPPAKPGAVTARWANDGSFSFALVMPTSGAGLDCVKTPCAVYTTTTTGNNGRLSIPVTFGAATSSSPSSSSSAATSSSASSSISTTASSETTETSTTESSTTSSVAPSTVQPKSIRADSIVAGGAQEVLFAGFQPGEKVAITLFSAPVQLPDVTTDGDGVVKIDFTVPSDLPAGTHTVQAIGRTSRTTGIARFVVTAPPVTSPSSTPSSPSPTTSSTSPTTVSSTASVSSTAVSSSTVASSAPVTTRTTAAAAAATNSKPVWPWYVLGMIVLICVVIGLVALSRRRSRLAAENEERRRLLAEAAAHQQYRADQALLDAHAEAPTTYLGQYPGPEEPVSPPGYRLDAHGLLSGRENADDPGLLSGQDYVPPLPEERTTVLPPVPPYAPPVSAGPDESADDGGRTERLTDGRRRHAAQESDAVRPAAEGSGTVQESDAEQPAAEGSGAARSDPGESVPPEVDTGQPTSAGETTRAWTPTDADDDDDDDEPPRGRHGL